jgi:hypothetical protein
MARCWRRLHSEEFNNFYTSSHINRVVKSRKIRLAGHIAHIRNMRNAYKILVGRPRRRCENDLRSDHGKRV